MDTSEIRLSACLSKGWQAFEKNAGLAIGCSALYTIIASAVSYTGVGTILALFPLLGGLFMIYLGFAKGLTPDLPTLFGGFTSVDNWARWLGVGWLLYLYQLVLLLASAIVGGVLWGPGIYLVTSKTSVAAGTALIGVGALITFIAYAAVAMRWVFVYPAGAEGATAFDAIRISTELTEGLRFRIFWIMLVLGLINLLGMLCCFIGIFVTMPIVECAVCSLYLDIKRLKAQPMAPETPAG